MKKLSGTQIVEADEVLEVDLRLLRSLLPNLSGSATRGALTFFIEGLEGGGAVVGKLGDLLTPQEAGEMIGVSRQYVDKLIASGRLRAQYKPGSTHRIIRASDVLAFTRKREEGHARIDATIDELIEAGLEY